MRDVISQNIRQRINNLNENQQNAVESILEGWQGSNGRFIFPIVEGPPGTGKTVVGVLAASQYVLENERGRSRPEIAYLTYTHYAAERAREAFLSFGFDPEEVKRLTADTSIKNWEQGIIGCRDDLSDLTEEGKRRLRNTPILISTLHGSGKIFNKIQRHPLIIIDEFSQVSPSLFFSIMSKVRTSDKNPSGYVLLGDPNQLPVITSQPLLRPNIGIFIFSRRNYQPHELRIQYRMHQSICQVVNALREALNTYPLDTHESVRQRTLTDLGYRWDSSMCPSDFQEIMNPKNPCIVINTDNLPGGEETSLGGSKYFSSEARLAARLARAIARSYTDISGNPLLPIILSPYDAQKGAIQNYLADRRLQEQCTTIYQAQGREYPCVIVSFARKNPQGWIGFLAESELRAQTYVACSRPKSKLIILFSFSTFQGYNDYDILLERCSNNALVIDAESSWGAKR